MLRSTLTIVLLALAANASAADYDPWTSDLEFVIEKQLAFFLRAPCKASHGFLVSSDTRCRASLPLTDEDRTNGVLKRVIINYDLVCRKRAGDIEATYMLTYEEQPKGLWKPVATNDADREMLKRSCN